MTTTTVFVLIGAATVAAKLTRIIIRIDKGGTSK